MSVIRKAIPRRTLLKGAGVSIALPMLEAMLPFRARAQDLTAPLRLGIFCFPFGTYRQAWAPTTFGTGYVLPDNLRALAPHKARIVLTKGLGAHGLPQGTHMAAIPYFTTEPIPGCIVQVRSPSVDMQIQSHLQRSAPHLKALVTNGGPPSGSYCGTHEDNKFFSFTQSFLSWTGTTSPASQIQTPQAAFDYLFSGVSASAVDPMAEFRRQRGLSVLDSVLGQATSLTAKVGAADKQTLDQYFTALREIETRLRIPASQPMCAPGTRPNTNLPFDQATRAFLDVAVLAMVCDRTRVVSHCFDSESEIYRQMPWIGVGNPGHHLVTHTDTSEGGMAPADKVTNYLKITDWYAQQLAYLLMKMQSFQELERDLLYNSLIVYGSGMGPDGQSHNNIDLSLVLAGELGGKIRTGTAHNFSGVRMANLWLTVMQKFGMNTNSYASSTGVLSL